MVKAYLAFLVLLAIERLFELWLSRRNARLAFARGAVELGRAHFPAMALLHTLFLFSCAAEVLLLQRAFPGILGFFALGAALFSQALRYWAIATLGPRWNVRVLVVPGEEPVTGGPYRFLRHPNYLAVIAELLSVPLIHGAFLTAIIFSTLNAILLTVRIRAEERALGEPYARAFAGRPRFLPQGARAALPAAPASPAAARPTGGRPG